MLGESPQRPGNLKARPLVVVIPDISPFAFRTEQLIVPVCGKRTLRMARSRNLGSMPTLAAISLSLSKRFCQSSELGDVSGGFQPGVASPGPHQSSRE